MRPATPTNWRSRQITLAAAYAAIVLSSVPSVAAADPILTQFVGDWVGHGTYKAGPLAPPESLYCKLTNTLSNDGSTLQQKGRCSIPSRSGAVKGKIVAQGGGKYNGSLDTLATEGAAALFGKETDGRLDLTAQYTDARTKREVIAAVSLVPSGSKYRLVTKTTRNGTSFIASDVTFTHP